MVNFPSSLDNGVSLPYPSALSKRNGPSLAGLNDNQNDAIIAVQTKLGITASTPTVNNLLIGTGAGTSTWSKLAPTGLIVGTTDTQTLTNKTLTGTTLTSPVITNATISTDLVSGFTTSNSGSIFGVAVTAGTLSGASIAANTITATQLASNAITGSKILNYSTIRQNDTTNVSENTARILTGWGVIAYNTGATNMAETVLFNSTFVNLPIVTLTFGGDNSTLQTYGSGGNNVEGNVIAKTASITATGFSATFNKPGGANFAAGYCFYQWTAIGA